jgi:hypothetical protein
MRSLRSDLCYARDHVRATRAHGEGSSPGQTDDGSFDRDFWRKIGPEGILEAAWDMVNEARAMKGLDGD